MLYAGGLLGLVLLLVWLFCIIDVIMTPGEDCQYLPKLLWLGIVVLLGDLGSVLWLLVGRPWPGGSPLARLTGRGGGASRGGVGQRSAPAYPEYDHPDRFAASNPDDDDAFLAQVRARAEAQRRAETTRRREREQAEITVREHRARSRRDPRTDGTADAPEDPDEPGPSEAR